MKYILPTIILLLVVFSCKKSDHPCGDNSNNNNKYYPIDSSFDSYRFKEGSYWVYQNDVSAQIDSQYVANTSFGKIGSGGGSTCSSVYAEVYTMGVQSSLSNHLFTYRIQNTAFSKNLHLSDEFAGTYILTSLDIQQPADIPSMTINGTTFSNVRKVFVEELDGESYKFYFVDSIGLVKWEKVDGATVLESWGIKSWDVIL